jgi:polyhydroxyalkanoate synthesis repressor PhaR
MTRHILMIDTMIQIKRYSNRKLYNTETKEYISLDDITRMVSQGIEVQVVDHKTGKDLTALTLTRILMKQEKHRDGAFSKKILTQLVQTGEEFLGAFLNNPIFEEKFFEYLKNCHIATKEDIHQINVQIDDLTTKIDRILNNQS